MQYLKAETKDKLRKNAEYLFLTNGYSTTSIRELAKVSGISKSNFYSYYGSKEELLQDIAKDFLTDLNAFLVRLVEDSFEYSFTETAEFMELLASEISKILKKNRTALLIFMSNSKTNEFIEFKERVSSILSEKIKRLYFQEPEDSQLIDILIDNVVAAIIRIVNDEDNEILLSQKLKKLMNYHLSGLKSIASF